MKRYTPLEFIASSQNAGCAVPNCCGKRIAIRRGGFESNSVLPFRPMVRPCSEADPQAEKWEARLVELHYEALLALAAV